MEDANRSIEQNQEEGNEQNIKRRIWNVTIRNGMKGRVRPRTTIKVAKKSRLGNLTKARSLIGTTIEQSTPNSSVSSLLIPQLLSRPHPLEVNLAVQKRQSVSTMRF